MSASVAPELAQGSWPEVRARILEGTAERARRRLAERDRRRSRTRVADGEPKCVAKYPWDSVKARELWERGMPAARIGRELNVGRRRIRETAKLEGWVRPERVPRRRLDMEHLGSEMTDTERVAGPFGVNPISPYARAVKLVEEESGTPWESWPQRNDARLDRAVMLAREIAGIEHKDGFDFQPIIQVDAIKFT